MNAGVWIGIIGGIAGLAIGIVAVLTTAGSLGIYIAGGMLLLFGGMAFLFYKLFFQQMLLANRLSKTGIPGKAVIKEVHDTGVTINNNPQVKLVLEVKNNLGQIYAATIRTLVSRIQPGMYQPGMTVPVLIDPKNENNIVIDLNGQNTTSSFSNQAQADSLKSELENLQQYGDAIRSTGRAARAIVKSYQWLGVHVNGNNPYAELKIEVLPSDAPAFESTVKGVVHEQSVGKFQPGQEIYVKYDPDDLSKVTIDHS